MTRRDVLSIVLGLGACMTPVALAVQAQSKAPSKAVIKATPPQSAPQKAGQFHSEGERIFVQNCSRCHTAPDGFSPRISGTVVRHMRVRAQLSAHDEQELLRFFNP